MGKRAMPENRVGNSLFFLKSPEFHFKTFFKRICKENKEKIFCETTYFPMLLTNTKK